MNHTPLKARPDTPHAPLWSAEFESGDSPTIGYCRGCKKKTIVRFGTWNPIQESDHWCLACIQKLSTPTHVFIDYEDLSIDNFFGM
jgi:hypothetical protein